MPDPSVADSGSVCGCTISLGSIVDEGASTGLAEVEFPADLEPSMRIAARMSTIAVMPIAIA
jgi:hypothetical protein